MSCFRRSTWGIFLIIMPIALACGCAPQHENLPTYQWSNDQTALQIMTRRAQAVKTVSAESLLTLTRPDGQSVRLDGAIALSLPSRSVRLRAWKFSQAVFDLTLTPRGLWIETPGDKSRRQQVLPASVSAAQLARAMSLFDGDVFDGPAVKVIDTGGPRFQIRKPLDQGRMMTADVERATLTVRQYRLSDPSGTVHFTLTPQHYQDLGGIVWPTRLIAQSDHGRIDVQLRDIDLNSDLPSAAFVPPPGAEKIP